MAIQKKSLIDNLNSAKKAAPRSKAASAVSVSETPTASRAVLSKKVASRAMLSKTVASRAVASRAVASKTALSMRIV